jgi:hypothetical protein
MEEFPTFYFIRERRSPGTIAYPVLRYLKRKPAGARHLRRAEALE